MSYSPGRSRIGPTAIANQYSRWENKDRDSEALPREKLLAKYFDLLDDDEILELYTIFQNDFQMFGYSFQFRGLNLNLSKNQTQEIHILMT